MSNFFSPATSSIKVTGQQCGNFQIWSSGSSSGTSWSRSGAYSSNTKHASVELANETGGNALAAVAGAKAIVNLNRSIRTVKPSYPKRDGDFKTWSNVVVQSENDASK